MTAASKLNILLIAMVTAVAMVLFTLLTWQHYHVALDLAADRATARVASRTDLQWLLYRGDTAALEKVLAALSDRDDIVNARAYSRIGEQLAASGETGGLAFATLRASTLATDTALRGSDGKSHLTGTGLLATWLGSASEADLSVPVVAAVNPDNKDLTGYDFLMAATRPPAEGSSFVVGYVHLGIDLASVRAAVYPRVKQVMLMWLVPLAIGVGLLLLWNRRTLANLRELASTVDAIAEEQFDKPVDLSGGSEFSDISKSLNRLSQRLQSHEQEIQLGRDLLSRKVEERTTQLSQSHEELNRATEAASESEQRLQQLTYYDSLTSLPNRRLFTEQFGLLMRLTRRAGQTLALLFLDLDNFRRINDSLGHHAGDLLLREVAKRLKYSVRDSDAIAQLGDAEHNIAVSRMGGDEFTVVLNQLDSPESAAMVAQRIIRRLSEPMEIDGHEIAVQPSVGIAVYPGDGDNAGTLLNAAATAMQAAKKNSNEGFLYFKRSMIAAGTERLRIETDLRQAVERQELVLHFQPQIDTVMGSVSAIEALLRWEHPEQGLVSPFDFVAIAEETGMMGKIGNWVLGEACQRLKSLENTVSQLPRVAINVSATQLTPAFAANVRSVLARTGLNPNRLELSLAEPVLTVADESLLGALNELRSIGVYFSLDGYGLGQASLAQLSRFPLDELKIEREFVTDFREQGHTGTIQSLVATAKSLGLQPCAEGVETRQDFQFLAEQGVKQMQGYLFSKPVPLETLLPMLAPWHFSEQIRKLGSQPIS